MTPVFHTYQHVPAVEEGYVCPGRKNPKEYWEVGIYAPGRSNAFHQRIEWTPVKTFSTEAEAAAHVHYLNGGKS